MGKTYMNRKLISECQGLGGREGMRTNKDKEKNQTLFPQA
jgi:hypothetical protein